MKSISDLRTEFPGASRRVYFNSAGIGLASRAASAAIKDFVDLAELDPRGAHHGNAHTEAREAAARLVGARPENIALVPSTSLALNIAADAIPLAGGENVVTTDLEFMSVIAPWFEKCRSVNAELRIAHHKGGRIDPEHVIDLIDDNTRAVTLSAVQWTNGYRIDVAPIGAECRRRSIPLIIDAIQQIGVIPFDVERNAVDFLACGGHKWLCSPSAMGFAYVSDRFATEFRPSLSYVPTSRPPDSNWQASWNDPAYDPVRTYALRETAARFEHGVHHGALGAAGLAAAINLLLDVGPENATAHIVRLANRVALAISELGYQVVTPLEDEFRSGITVFRTSNGAEGDIALCEELAARGIDMSVRYTSGIGGLRVSTHVYNDDQDVDRFIDTLVDVQGN
jgi:selenocysteine lyase/cysteine desulfurase